MPTELDKLIFRLEADVSQLRSAMEQAQGFTKTSADRINQSLGGVAKGGNEVNRSFEGLKGSVKEAGVAALGFAGIALGLTEVMTKVYTETIAAERSINRVEQTLAQLGRTAAVTSADVEFVAKAMASATRFDTTGVRNAADILLTFGNVSHRTFEPAVKLAGDLAASMGTEIPEAARILARALVEPGEGLQMLQRAGVKLTDSQIELVKSVRLAKGELQAQELAINLLTDKVGGRAEGEKKNLYGVTVDLSHAWADLMETMGRGTIVGNLLTHAFDGLAKVLERINGALQPESLEDKFNRLATSLAQKERQLQRAQAEGMGAQVKQLEKEIAALQAQLDEMGAELDKTEGTGTLPGPPPEDNSARNLRDFQNLARELGLVANGYAVMDANAAKAFDMEQKLNEILAAQGDKFLPTYVQMMELVRRKYGELAEPHGRLLKQLEDEQKVLAVDEEQRKRREFELQVEEALIGKTGEEYERLKRVLMATYDDTVRARVEDFIKTSEKHAQQQEEINAALRTAKVEWDDASQAMRINTREADILAKTYELLNRNIGLTVEQARKIAEQEVDAAEQRRKVDATNDRLKQQAEQQRELMLEPFKNALRGMQEAFSDFFQEVFSGGVQSFGDLSKAIKQIFVKLAAELATLMIIRPAIGGILGSIGMGGIAQQMGLGGFNGPVGPIPGFSGTAGGVTGPSGASGSSGFNFPSFNFGNFDLLGSVGAQNLNAFGLGGLSQFLGGAGPSTIAAAGSTVTGPGGLLIGGGAASQATMMGSGFAMPSFGGMLGGAGMGFGIGSLIGSFGIGGKTGSGAQIGGTIGGLAGSIFGPVGSFAGSVLGSVIGSFFGPKKSVGPYSQSSGFLDASGNLVSAIQAGDNGATGDAARGIFDSLQQGIQKFFSAYGVTATRDKFGFAVDTRESGTTVYDTFTNGTVLGTGTNMDSLGVQVLRSLAKQGVFSLPNASMNTAFTNSKATTMEELGKDLDFAKMYDDLVNVKRATTDFENSMKALVQQLHDGRDQAEKLGLDPDAFGLGLMQRLNLDMKDQLKQLTDPLGAALDLQERNAKARLETVKALGADEVLAEKLNAAERLQILQQFNGTLLTQMKSIQDFLNGLALGDLSTLNPMQKLDTAKSIFFSASTANDAIAAASPLLQVARDLFASSPEYVQIFNQVNDRLRQIQASLGNQIIARARGGLAFGLTRVGEYGPEVVDFRSPGMVFPSGTSPASNDNGVVQAMQRQTQVLFGMVNTLSENFMKMTRELSLDNQRKRFVS